MRFNYFTEDKTSQIATLRQVQAHQQVIDRYYRETLFLGDRLPVASFAASFKLVVGELFSWLEE